MLRKIVKAAAFAVMASIVGLISVGVAGAAAPTGTGPDQALAPTSTWQSVQPAATTWYSFQYAGDNSQIEVVADVSPADSVAISIWTPQNVQDWAKGLAVEPIGRGSVDADRGGALTWSGSFNTAGAYYIVVQPTGANIGYYDLSVSGSGVTTSVSAAAQTQAAAAPVANPAPAVVVAVSGAAPEQSFAIPAYSAPIAQGASAWHTFTYAGDESNILVWLDAQGQSGLQFSVYTPDAVQQMEMGQSVSPVGIGSVDTNAPGDLSWSGNFPQAGSYYVKVTNTSSVAMTYTLNAKGSGVW